MAQVFNHAILLRARLELNLTQEQAAAAAGVDVRTYRRYESGAVNDPREGFSVRHPTRRRMLERLSTELGIPGAELVVETQADAGADAGAGAGAGADTGAGADAGAGTDADADADAVAAAVHARSWKPLHAHTLQRARHFVAREGILAILSEWMAETNPSRRVIALVALGGAGKTAIVERFAASLGDGPRAGGVLIWSFYEDPKAESFLARALDYFAPGMQAAPGERLERLEDALRQGPPHLLLLDGIETMQAEGGSGRAHGELNDALLRRLLFALARGLGATRALVTSRFELSDLGAWEHGGLSTLRLGSLTESEGAALLRRWGIQGGERSLEQLVTTAGGHALSLAMIGSYVGAFLGGDASRLDSIELGDAAREDVLARRLHAVLSTYAKALSSEERDLMARLSVFPGGIGEDAMMSVIRAGGDIAGSLAGFTVTELRRSLAKLERLGLVFSAREGQPGSSTHPFVRGYFKSLLGVPPERIFAARAQEPPRLDSAHRSRIRDGALLDAYEELLGHTLDAGRPDEAYAIYTRSLGGFGNLGLRLGDMSRGARIMRAFAADDDPRRIAPSLPGNLRGALAYDWGLYAGALGDLAFACRCYEAHDQIARTLGGASEIATSLRTLSYTERLRGSLPEAQLHIEESSRVAAAAGETEHWIRAVALQGSILHDMGKVDEAGARFAAIRAMGASPIARRGLWEAEHDLALGRRDAARAITEHNLTLCASLGWEGHLAHCHTVLGLILAGSEGRTARDEDVEAARGHLARARVWAGTTGEVEVALRCHELAARIELAAGQAGHAARHAGDGLRLAETCGFVLWAARLGALAAKSALETDPEGAAALAMHALETAAAQDAWGRADALHWAGAAFARAGQAMRARQLLREAATLRARIKHPEAGASREALAALQ